jgi:hypothetical protein
VAAQFVIELAQARAWLKRGVEDGVAEALKRPIRYQVIASRRLSLLDSNDADSQARER